MPPILAGQMSLMISTKLRTPMPYFIYKKKHYKPRSNNTTHLLLLLVLFVIAVNKIQFLQNIDTVDMHSNVIATISVIRNMEKPRYKEYIITKHTHWLAVLLIIAGDVHTNPGPPKITDVKLKPQCTMCRELIHQDLSLQCNTCRGWCHISCSGNKEKKQYYRL